MAKGEEKTFARITNYDILKEIRDIKSNIEYFQVENSKEHAELTIQAVRTNGKVKLNRWIATTALTTIITLCLYLMKVN